MRDLGLILIITGLILAAGVAVHRLTRTSGQPRKHVRKPDDGAERASMAKLRGQPADRFTPGVVVPFTPRLGEPLKPLPEPPTKRAVSLHVAPEDASSVAPPDVPGPALAPGPDAGQISTGHDPGPGTLFAEVADEPEPFETDDEFIESVAHLLPPAALLTDEQAAEIKERFAETVRNRQHLIALPPAQPDADDDIRRAAEQFNPRPGDKPARPAHALDGQTTGELMEHICVTDPCWCKPWEATPDVPPAEVVRGLNGHYTVDAAVESMFTRAQAAQVRALANGQVSDA